MKNECKCKFCGKVFVMSRKDQKYCNENCRIYDYSNKIAEQRKNAIEPRKCGICGNVFTPLHSSTKYCSPKCAYKAKTKKNITFNQKETTQKNKAEEKSNSIKKHTQPCWDCVNACGHCNWSKYLKPVDGWEAEEVTLKEDYKIKGFLIKKCPEYVKGRALPMEI